MTTPAVERFWPKVVKTNGCWVWMGATAGYSHGRFLGPDRRVVAAHRFSWELENGPIPAGAILCHHCDNPPCVRPDHLFVGTQRDNVADMKAKGRAAVGVRHPGSKLTEPQVVEMRVRYATGDFRLLDLSREYGVTFGIVSQIVRGIRYPMVGGPRTAKAAFLGRHLSEAQARRRTAA